MHVCCVPEQRPTVDFTLLVSTFLQSVTQISTSQNNTVSCKGSFVFIISFKKGNMFLVITYLFVLILMVLPFIVTVIIKIIITMKQ